MACLVSLSLHAQDNDQEKFSYDGFAAFTWLSGHKLHSDLLQVGEVGTTFRPTLRWKNDSWSLVTEFDVSQYQIDNSNWVQQIALGYQSESFWSVRIGRIPTSLIRITPAPKVNPTVMYPSLPREIYAWGTQIGIGDERWQAWFDITDESSSFQGSDTFSSLQFGARLQRNFENAHVALNLQGSDDTFRGVVDFGWSQEKFSFRGAVYMAEDHHIKYWNAYLYGSYRLVDPLEVHILTEYRNDNLFFSPGIRYIFSEKVDLTAGYRFSFDEAVLRFRVRF